MDRSTNITIACHDAGAANLIMAEQASLGFPARHYCLEGPAKSKWAGLIPQEKLTSEIRLAIASTDELHVGTGWASNFEFHAIELAKLFNKYVVATIDHWVNYRERFIRNGQTLLPDRIVVADKYALDMAQSIFPNTPIVLKKNFYLENALAHIKKQPANFPKDILYVLEPIRAKWEGDQDQAGEFQALDYFTSFVQNSATFDYRKIRLRPHPSEDRNKYSQWIDKNHALRVELDPHINIEESIATSQWVFGCESYGLVIALYCNKPTYCTIPPWAPRSRLPHEQLIHLRDIFQ